MKPVWNEPDLVEFKGNLIPRERVSGYSSVVESQFSKLLVVGSIPTARSNFLTEVDGEYPPPSTNGSPA